MTLRNYTCRDGWCDIAPGGLRTHWGRDYTGTLTNCYHSTRRYHYSIDLKLRTAARLLDGLGFWVIRTYRAGLGDCLFGNFLWYIFLHTLSLEGCLSLLYLLQPLWKLIESKVNNNLVNTRLFQSTFKLKFDVHITDENYFYAFVQGSVTSRSIHISVLCCQLVAGEYYLWH